MVSIFGVGGRRGPRGPAGPRGRDGMEDLKPLFFPQLLEWTRKNASCSFYFEDEQFIKKDAGGKVVDIISHSRHKLNAKSVGDEGAIFRKEEIDETYCLDFAKKTIFSIDVSLAYTSDEPRTCFAIMSFEIYKTPTEEQVIFGDEDLLRGVTIDRDHIKIHGGTHDLKFRYDTGFIIIGVFWKNVGDYQGLYFINNDSGTFETKKCELTKAPPILVGKKFEGSICVFDIIQSLPKYWDSKSLDFDPVPEQSMDILIQGHRRYPQPI